MAPRMKAILISFLLVPFCADIVLAKCRISLPRKDWSWSRAEQGYVCRSESCGGKVNLLRFGDSRMRPAPGLKGGFKIVPTPNLPPHFKGMMRMKIEDRHGRLYHIKESYLGERRLVDLYSEGVSKQMVRKNLAVLKSSMKCR